MSEENYVPYPKIEPVKAFIVVTPPKIKWRERFWGVIPAVFFMVAGITTQFLLTDFYLDHKLGHDQTVSCSVEAPQKPVSVLPSPPPFVPSSPAIEAPEPKDRYLTPKITIEPIIPDVPADPVGLKSVIDAHKFYLAAKRNDGKIELRTGGTVGWRLNNPTRMLMSDYAKASGAIGEYSGVAIFPTYDLGRKATKSYLFDEKNDYAKQDLQTAFKADALKAILAALKVPPTTKLKDLSEDQQNQILDIIQKQELWIEGKVSIFDNDQDFKDRGWGTTPK